MEQEKVRIAVLVSGGGTNLQALIDAAKAGKIPDGELALVLSSNPDAFAIKRAMDAGIPVVCVPKKACSSQEDFEEQLLFQLELYRVELIVLAGFMCILSADFTGRYPERILNVHPSLIPSFCGKGFYGLRVHQEALRRGVKVTGATVHFVNEVPDGGRIIAQKAVEVLEGDTPEQLQKRVMEQAEWSLLPQAAAQVSAAIRKDRRE